MLVILVASLDTGLSGANYQMAEMFAGRARISRLAKSLGLRVCAHDVLYDTKAGLIDESCFNINQDAGYVLSAQCDLQCAQAQNLGTTDPANLKPSQGLQLPRCSKALRMTSSAPWEFAVHLGLS